MTQSSNHPDRTMRAEELNGELSAGRDVMLIDVRRPADYQAAPTGLPGAVWRNPEELAKWSEQLPTDKEIVVYCVRGGAISSEVVDHLRAKKLNARFIEGGLTAWQATTQKR